MRTGTTFSITAPSRPTRSAASSCAARREHPGCAGPADALCTALQILNHLQDCRADREALDRIYLPVAWMAVAGGETAFFAPANGARRRAVLDAALDRVEDLIACAEGLPERLSDRRLRAQSLATIALARPCPGACAPPIPSPAALQVGRGDVLRAFLGGLRGLAPVSGRDARGDAGGGAPLGLLLPARHAEPARGAPPRHPRGLCLLPRGGRHRRRRGAARREAPLPGRLAARDRRGIPRAPRTPIGRELARAAALFDLPLAECHALLDGMETDSGAAVRLADDAALALYGRRVAGSVGALSIRIFGAPGASISP